MMTSQPSQPSQTAKKPYKKPNLKLYGDIHTITGAVGQAALMVDSSLMLKTN
jgi:formyltetrahydrofolate synthetase